MGFKKLALASAILAIPSIGFSMETIDDAAMSEVSGQDGIEAVLALGTAGLQMDIVLHDKGGINSLATNPYASYSHDGAIVIDNMQIGVGGANIGIEIDAGDNASAAVSAPVLNIKVSLPVALTISTGSIHVANSGRDDAAPSFGINGAQSATILNNMTIILGNTSLNIQLGNEVQTGSVAGADMINIGATVTNGISITGFRLSDATLSGDGGIGATGAMTMTDVGGTNLSLAVDINATDAGLVVGLGQVGAAGGPGVGGMNITIVDQYLGSSSAGIVGDVAILGLNLNGATLTISGK